MKTAFEVVATDDSPTWYAEVWPGRGQLQRQPGSLGRIILRHTPESEEAGQDIHGQIPKSYKVKNQWGQLVQNIDLHANDRTGETNEAGIARYRKLRKKLDEMGHKVQFGPAGFDVAAHDFPSEEEFEQALRDQRG